MTMQKKTRRKDFEGFFTNYMNQIFFLNKTYRIEESTTLLTFSSKVLALFMERSNPSLSAFWVSLSSISCHGGSLAAISTLSFYPSRHSLLIENYKKPSARQLFKHFNLTPELSGLLEKTHASVQLYWEWLRVLTLFRFVYFADKRNVLVLVSRNLYINCAFIVQLISGTVINKYVWK